MNTRKAPYPKIGMKFGDLTVVSAKEDKRGGKGTGKYYWRVKCKCGKELWVWNHNLFTGNTKACRCVTKKHVIERCTTHGMRYTRQYRTWFDMKRRCNDTRRADYPRYGGRGIKVCKEWNTFEGFWKDMWEGYSDTLTIDRIDNEQGYYKENCRWATAKEQRNNRRIIK